jgi:PPE-repeat protein
MDFGVLPPEINSGRMYSGAGSGPMLAAAASWDGLAAQLHATAASYESVIANLTGGWRGPSSATMATAVAPYTVWMSATAAQAEQAADQARAAVAAYEAAFAATVPPPVIAANRAQLMALIATNIFGQNTPAIMATEAQYAEMWAQDTAAMYGYSGSSASAAQVTPFTQPPQTTNPTGTARQSAAVAQATGASAGNTQTTLAQLMAAVPQSLQSLVATAAADPPAAAADPLSLLSALDMALTGPLGPTSLFGIVGSPYLVGVESYLLPQNAANLTSANERLERDRSKLAVIGGGNGPGARVLGSPGSGGGGVPAGMGRARFVGGLSVPQGWASAAPVIRQVAAVLPQTALPAAPAAFAADGQGSMFSNLALSGLAGRAMAGSDLRYVGAVGSAGSLGAAATTATIIIIPADDVEE